MVPAVALFSQGFRTTAELVFQRSSLLAQRAAWGVRLPPAEHLKCAWWNVTGMLG